MKWISRARATARRSQRGSVNRGALWVMLFACWVAGCATTSAFRLTAEGGDPWLRLTSRNLTMYTNMAEDDAKKVIGTYQARYDMVVAELLRGKKPPALRSHVVVFRDAAQFKNTYGRGKHAGAGLQLTGLQFRSVRERDDVTGAFVRLAGYEPLMLMGGKPTRRQLQAWQHGIVHRLLQKALPHTPWWLNDGLASYYSTAVVENDHLILGRVPVHITFTTYLDWRTEVHDGIQRAIIPIAHTASPSELLKVEQGAYYIEAPPDTKQTWDDQQLRLRHYASSWALVHMFLNGPEQYGEILAEALAQAAAGEWVGKALSTRLPNSAQLDHDYRVHLGQSKTNLWRIPCSPTELGAVEVNKLTPSETLALGGKIAMVTNGTPGPLLDQALASEPNDPDLLYLKGLSACRSKDYVVCEESIRAAAKNAPEQPRFWSKLLWLYDENPGAIWSDAEVTQRLAEAEANLLPLGLAAYHHNILARAKVRRQQVDQAEEHAKKALELEPHCWECLDTMAWVKFARGDTAAATTYQQQAIDRAAADADSDTVAELNKRLEKYRRVDPLTAPTDQPPAASAQRSVPSLAEPPAAPAGSEEK